MALIWAIVCKVGVSWAGRLLTAEMIEWAILWGAKRLVAHTKTPHDDEWFAKVEATLRAPKEGAK